MPEPFQHPHPKAGPGQIGGGDQAVVSATDDYSVWGVCRVPAQLR